MPWFSEGYETCIKFFLCKFKSIWVDVHLVNELLMLNCCSLAGVGISQCRCVWGEGGGNTSTMRIPVRAS